MLKLIPLHEDEADQKPVILEERLRDALGLGRQIGGVLREQIELRRISEGEIAPQILLGVFG